ncbi:MAG: DUF5131 family protein [Stellaceae bacterium]
MTTPRVGIDWLGRLSLAPATATGAAPADVAPPNWYDVTWNPTAGCSPIGPGCGHCDAMRTVAQLARMGGKGGTRYAGLTTTGRAGVEWTGELRVRDDVLAWPLLQRRTRRILVNSLSDLFHERLATQTIDAVHAVMTVAHWHKFLVQTRRATRMRAYYVDPETPRRIAVEIGQLAEKILPGANSAPGEAGTDAPSPTGNANARRAWTAGLARVVTPDAAVLGPEPTAVTIEPWPLPNLYLGVSVEDETRAGRLGELLQTPAALRWACFEPLLGEVRLDHIPLGDGGYLDALSGFRFDIDDRGRRLPIAAPALPALDWVVAGGETGIGARPILPGWIRTLRDACAAAGVPFYFKQ